MASNCLFPSLYKYRNIFGEPNKGVHSYRIGGFAAVDVILTIIAAIFIAWFFDTSLIATSIALLFLGIVSHKVFCVDTKLNNMLGL